jgi:hypothetical protein
MRRPARRAVPAPDAPSGRARRRDVVPNALSCCGRKPDGGREVFRVRTRVRARLNLPCRKLAGQARIGINVPFRHRCGPHVCEDDLCDRGSWGAGCDRRRWPDAGTGRLGQRAGGLISGSSQIGGRRAKSGGGRLKIARMNPGEVRGRPSVIDFHYLVGTRGGLHRAARARDVHVRGARECI